MKKLLILIAAAALCTASTLSASAQQQQLRHFLTINCAGMETIRDYKIQVQDPPSAVQAAPKKKPWDKIGAVVGLPKIGANPDDILKVLNNKAQDLGNEVQTIKGIRVVNAAFENGMYALKVNVLANQVSEWGRIQAEVKAKIEAFFPQGNWTLVSDNCSSPTVAQPEPLPATASSPVGKSESGGEQLVEAYCYGGGMRMYTIPSELKLCGVGPAKNRTTVEMDLLNISGVYKVACESNKFTLFMKGDYSTDFTLIWPATEKKVLEVLKKNYGGTFKLHFGATCKDQPGVPKETAVTAGGSVTIQATCYRNGRRGFILVGVVPERAGWGESLTKHQAYADESQKKIQALDTGANIQVKVSASQVSIGIVIPSTRPWIEVRAEIESRTKAIAEKAVPIIKAHYRFTFTELPLQGPQFCPNR